MKHIIFLSTPCTSRNELKLFWAPIAGYILNLTLKGLVEDIKTKPESIDKTEDKPGAVRILSSFKSG